MKQAPERREVRAWLLEEGPVEALRRVRESFPSLEDPNVLLGLPPAEYLAARQTTSSLDSLPFYSLCRGLLLPLMVLPPDREMSLFGFTSPVLTPEERKALVEDFLARPLGLKLPEKLGVILGDPFLGHSPGVREDSLTNVLANLVLWPVAKVRQSISQAGDLAGLFAMSRQRPSSDPPLASRVVLLALQGLRDFTLRQRRELLRDLYGRCGRLEAYCLTGLILNKLHLALSARQDYLLEILARQFGAPLPEVEMVATLRDVFELGRLLEDEGPAGLSKVSIQPLSPLRPALAGATIATDLKLPAWVECKYDGVRLMVHKTTDSQGRVLVAAYTRKRNDWVELIPGMQPLAQALPCQSVILDGELHGTVLSDSGVPRPGTVYEVHDFLRGSRVLPVNLRYVGFDLLYLNGTDLTRVPFRERRRQLEMLLTMPAQLPLPLPIALSQGSRVDTREQLNRIYEQYRRQGHEGAMVKVEDAPYPVAERTNFWMKRKPEETLELVITAAYWSDPTTAGQRMFDSYMLSCRSEGGLKEVATVGGLDTPTTLRVVQTIMGSNLLTGQPVEHRGSQRTAAGVALAPYLIVSVKYEAVVRGEDGEISLRGPRISALRPGEMPLSDIASLDDLRRLMLKQGLS